VAVAAIKASGGNTTLEQAFALVEAGALGWHQPGVALDGGPAPSTPLTGFSVQPIPIDEPPERGMGGGESRTGGLRACASTSGPLGRERIA